MIRFIRAAVLLTAGTGVSMPATAQDAQPYSAFGLPLEAKVTTRGLDLTTPEGVAALDARFKKAIRVVCPRGDYSPQVLKLAHRCERETLARLMPRRDAAIARAESRKAARLASRDADMH